MTRNAGMRPFEILLVEDNARDVRLVREALLEGPRGRASFRFMSFRRRWGAAGAEATEQAPALLHAGPACAAVR
jgi:hypothetical protein